MSTSAPTSNNAQSHDARPQSYVRCSALAMTYTNYTFIGLIVDGILSESTLRSAYERFIVHWPLMGGHLDTSVLPCIFHEGAEIDYLHTTISTTLAETLPYNPIPPPTSGSANAVQQVPCSTTDFGFSIFHHSLSRTPETPQRQGMFALRSTALADATLLGFRVPHYLCDALSTRAVVAAFADVVCGRVPPTLALPPDSGPNARPLSKLLVVDDNDDSDDNDDKQEPEWVHGERRRRIQMTEDEGAYAWITPKFEGGVGTPIPMGHGMLLHVCAGFAEGLKAECDAEMAVRGTEGTGLSKNDVLGAWLLKKFFAPGNATALKDDQPLHYSFAFNLCSLLPPPPAGSQYLMCTSAMAMLKYDTRAAFTAQSLLDVALDIRAAVLLNTSPSAVVATLGAWEERVDRVELRVPTGVVVGGLGVQSSWSAADYNGLSFEGALETMALKKGSGKVVHMQPGFVAPCPAGPMSVPWKDGEGGYWVRVNVLDEGFEI